MTNDVPALEQSLCQCEAALDTLASSAMSVQPNGPPISQQSKERELMNLDQQPKPSTELA